MVVLPLALFFSSTLLSSWPMACCCCWLLAILFLVPSSLWYGGYGGTFLTCAQQNTALLAARSRSNDILHQHDVILGSCYKSESESVHSQSVLLCTKTIMPLVDQQYYSSPLLLLLEQQQQREERRRRTILASS
jgi:hypothetical protein